jgi:hypothetical protein
MSAALTIEMRQATRHCPELGAFRSDVIEPGALMGGR